MEDVEPTTLMKLSPFQLPDSTTTTAQRLPLKPSTLSTPAVLHSFIHSKPFIWPDSLLEYRTLQNFIDVDVQNLLLDKVASSGGKKLGLSMQLFDTMAQHQDWEKLSELIGKYACEKGTESSGQGDGDEEVDVDDLPRPEHSDDSGPHEVDTGVALSRVAPTEESRLDPNNMVSFHWMSCIFCFLINVFICHDWCLGEKKMLHYINKAKTIFFFKKNPKGCLVTSKM